ncbi:MAG: methyl-accepting chemotaxis protein [Gammaproteobacteria bacterium]|nr:methyl-accepting chemotaxis protein [Gammaproteobacteria bacterium]
MNILLQPARALMSRLRFAPKMILVMGILLLATVLLAASVVVTHVDAVRAMDRELVGARYVRALLGVLVDVQQHRGMSSTMLSGDASLSAKVEAKAVDVEAGLAALAALDGQTPDVLRQQASIERAVGEWRALRQLMAGANGADNFARHSALIRNLLNDFRLAADASSLSFDPHPDSYTLMEASVLVAPATIEYLGQLRGRAASVSASRTLPQSSAVALGSLMQLSANHIDATERVLERVLTYSPEAAGSVSTAVTALREAFVATRTMIESSVLGERFDVAPAEVFNQATAPVVAALTTANTLLDGLDASLAAHRADTVHSLIVTSAGLATGVLLAVYLALGLYASLQQDIARTIRGGQLLAEGDLTARIEVAGRDEFADIARSFNRMADGLSALIGQVKTSAGDVTRVTHAVASATQQISEASAQQSQSASAMAATIEELSVSITSVSDGASDMRRAAEASNEEAGHGRRAIDAVSGELDAVGVVVGEISEAAAAFVASTRAISDMTRQVKDIAEQTNLLALNAAIEAARAGEQGRGFAVVADEVRKLAEKSAASALEIEQVTRTLDARAGGVDAVVRRGSQAIDASREQLNRVVEALTRAAQAAASTSEGIAGIAESVSEQTTASHDVARAVERIAQMSEENSHAIAAMADEAGRLRALAVGLDEAGARFRV